MQKQNTSNALLLLGFLGLLIGAYGIYEALFLGMGTTALSSPVPWGLGVVTYLYFLGLSGGGLLIALLTTVVRKKQFEAFSGVAAWAVLATEIAAGIAIATDLGHWERIYRFILSPNLQSPMAWMLVFFTALLLIYCVKILALREGNMAKVHTLTLWSIPIALLFYAINGYIFGMISAQPMWSGAFIPVWFVLAALLSGGALVGVLGWVHKFNDELMQGYGRVLLSLLVTFAVFETLYLLFAFQCGDAETTQALHNLLWGSGSMIFWGLHIIPGTLLPISMLARAKTAAQVGCSALMVVLTFIALRWSFVIPVQSVEPIEGLANAFHHTRLAYAYSPSLGEWLITIFVSSLCLVTLLIGPRFFPILFSEQGGQHA